MTADRALVAALDAVHFPYMIVGSLASNFTEFHDRRGVLISSSS